MRTSFLGLILSFAMLATAPHASASLSSKSADQSQHNISDPSRSQGKLIGKFAFITGGSSGIGQALVEGFLREGADVAFTYCSKQTDAEAAVLRLQQQGFRVHALAMDLNDRSSIEAALAKLFTLTAKVDIFVNNAATLINRPFLQTSFENLQATFSANVFGPFFLSQKLAQHMIDRNIAGSILHIGSFRGDKPVARLFAYSAAKASLHAMNTMMAEELSAYKIRVNLIAPGGTLTGMSRSIYDTQEKLEQRGQKVPLGRYGQPTDHVAAAVFLVSDAASWTTGTVLTIDGGESTRN